ncbi:MAG: hypothetical protein OXG68_12190 [Chloroflexi bacterium]|nr:hypothetical protein [Chloroflexota bacterium]
MNRKPQARTMNRITIILAVLLAQMGTALAQDGEASSAHEGMTMLVLFLGIAGIIGVFVIRWGQSTSDEEENS